MQMQEILKKNKFCLVLFLVVTAVYVVYSSIILRGAYIDGGLQELILLNKFSTGHYMVYTDPYHTRFFVNFIEQLPMAIGYFVFHIKSKYWLSFLYSLPTFLFPLLLLWWNYKLSERTKRYDIFVLSVFTYSTILLPYMIFSIVEATVSVLLLFILLNYLAGSIDYTKKDLFLILFLVVTMFGSHEFVALAGIILFIASLHYAKKEENSLHKKTKYLIGAFGVVASLYVGFFIISDTQAKIEASRFIREAVDFFPYLLSINALLSLIAFVIAVFLIFKKDYLKLISQVFIGSIFLVVLSYMLLNLNIYLNPMFEGHLRTVPCWGVPLVILVVLLLDIFKKRPTDIFYTNLLTLALICGIAHTFWQINNSYWFNKNIEYMKQEMKNSTDPLYIPENHPEMSSFYNKDLRRYIWKYSYASYSILFSPTKEVKTLLLEPVSREEADDTQYFHDWLYVEKDHIIVPCIKLHIKNEFWDTTKVSGALGLYIKDHPVKRVDAIEY